jgi:hypothetical protein
MRFTVDAIAGLAFGSDVNTLESDDDIIQQHLDKIFPKLFTRIISAIPYWRFFKLPSDRELDRALVAVNAAIDGFIASARQRLAADAARRTAPQSLLEAMLVAADDPGSGIDDDQVAGNVLTMLLAGEDTTANTLAWCIWLLHRHPQPLARAKAEARGVMDTDTTLTLEHLSRLDFIEACMNETMRLKPVGPFLPLQALKDSVVRRRRRARRQRGHQPAAPRQCGRRLRARGPGLQARALAGRAGPVGGLGEAHLHALWRRAAHVPGALPGTAGDEDGAADLVDAFRYRSGGHRARRRTGGTPVVRDGASGLAHAIEPARCLRHVGAGFERAPWQHACRRARDGRLAQPLAQDPLVRPGVWRQPSRFDVAHAGYQPRAA